MDRAEPGPVELPPTWLVPDDDGYFMRGDVVVDEAGQRWTAVGIEVRLGELRTRWVTFHLTVSP